jgi:hypothetical protein
MFTHKRPPLVPVLSQMHSIHTYPLYFTMNHSNIFPSLPRFSVWSPSALRVSGKNFAGISHHSYACYISRPSHSLWFGRPNNISCSVQFWSSSLLSLLNPPTTSSFVLIVDCTKLSTVLLFKDFSYCLLHTLSTLLWKFKCKIFVLSSLTRCLFRYA